MANHTKKGKLTCCDGTVIVGTWTNGEKEYEYTDQDYENAGGDERFAKYNYTEYIE